MTFSDSPYQVFHICVNYLSSSKGDWDAHVMSWQSWQCRRHKSAHPETDTAPHGPAAGYLHEVLPGGETGDQAVLPALGVGEGHVQAAVGQLVSVGRQNPLHAASEEERVTVSLAFSG